MINQSSKDRATGKAHEIKGKIKEETGRMTNRPDVQEKGADEKIAGKVQRKIGEVEKVLGN